VQSPVRFGAPRSFREWPRAKACWVRPEPPSRAGVSPARSTRRLAATVPRLCRRVHSPSSLAVLFGAPCARCLPSLPTCGLSTTSRERAPPMGFRVPLRGVTSGVHQHAEIPLRAVFRPRRSSRPRRFAPPLDSRVCCTPQPRPGFSLQGFVPLVEPCRLSPASCPRVDSSGPACGFPRQPTRPSPPGPCSPRECGDELER